MKLTSLFLLLLLILPIGSAAIVWGDNPIKTELTVVSNVPYCYEQSGMLYWYDRSGLAPAFNDCYRSNAEPKKCCPAGYSCMQDSGKYTCKDTGIESCAEYSQANCGNYDYGVAVADVESKMGEGYCSSVIPLEGDCNQFIKNCRCLWDSASSSCISSYNTTEVCSDGQEINSGECLMSVISSTNCTNRFKTVKWTSQWTGLASEKGDCVDAEREVPCLSASLGAVSNLSIILAVILIAVFYLVFSRKKIGRRK